MTHSETMTIYAIPDIHGQREMLEHALSLVMADGGPEAQIVFLGDLVDRGPDSRGVVETLMQGQMRGRPWIVLRGNHDQLFVDFLDGGWRSSRSESPGKGWLDPTIGGDRTLASYGVAATEATPNLGAARAAVPQAHRDWLAELPCYHETPELLFVHAGIRPGRPLADQTEDDLLWIREPFLSWTDPHPWLVVHGHTAIERATHFGNRIDLDGGAGWGRPLVPAVFEGRDCWVLTETGRFRLQP